MAAASRDGQFGKTTAGVFERSYKARLINDSGSGDDFLSYNIIRYLDLFVVGGRRSIQFGRALFTVFLDQSQCLAVDIKLTAILLIEFLMVRLGKKKKKSSSKNTKNDHLQLSNSQSRQRLIVQEHIMPTRDMIGILDVKVHTEGPDCPKQTHFLCVYMAGPIR